MRWCCLFLLVPWVLHATDLQDARATVDTVVAETGDLVPLRKLGAPIPFRNFRYPYVDADENVTFIGNDPFGESIKGHGIFRSVAKTGALESVLSTSDLAPDDRQPFGPILGLQSDGKNLVFHRGRDHGRGIYGIFGKGSPETVAGPLTLVPGRGGNFKWYRYGDVAGDLVVFNGSPMGSDPERWYNGLYLFNHADRSLQLLLDNTQPIAMLDGKKLGLISYQPRIDGRDIIFSAHPADPVSYKLEGARGIFGWKGVNAKDAATFSLSQLQIFAEPGMIIPESGGLKMTYAPNPVIRDGMIAVVGGFSPTAGGEEDGYPVESADYEAILVRTREGKWLNPMDTNTLVPRREDGAVFTSFNKWIALEEDRVIFIGQAEGDYKAVYTYDVATDTMYFVSDTTQKVEGKKIAEFEISVHPITQQTLAARIVFEDGSEGEYLAKLPGLPVKLKKKVPPNYPMQRRQ